MKTLFQLIFILILPMTLAADFVLSENDQWRKVRFNVNKIEKDSILDFTKVMGHHRPAGKYGFLKVKGDHFEFEKLPGVKQRFFGVNFSEMSNFPSKKDASVLAEAVARAGYNSVRLHHYDNYIYPKNAKYTSDLDSEKMDRLDFFIKQLKDRGIYVTLDFYVSRKINDNDMPGCANLPQWLYKYYVYIHPQGKDELIRFVRNFMTHKNPYTGLTYAEDPVFCYISVVNENNLKEWYPSNRHQLGHLWEAKFNQWADSNKISAAKRKEVRIRRRFIQDFMKDHWKTLSGRIRALGVRVPLTDQNHRHDPIYSLTRREFDYTDIHGYVAHPRFIGKDWRLPATCDQRSFMELPLDSPDVACFFNSRIHGKPYTATEIRWCKPLKARGEGGLITGAIAGLQDWSGLHTFQWAWGGKDYMKDSWGGFFDLYGDPTGYLSERMVHLLFLRGDVTSSNMTALQILPGDAAKLDPKKNDLSPLSGSLGFLMRVENNTAPVATASYTWLFDSVKSEEMLKKALSGKQIGEKGFFDPEKNLIRSTTGEIVYSGAEKLFKAATPKSEGIAFCDKVISARADCLNVETQTPYTTFFAASTDSSSLKDSKRIIFLHLSNSGHVNMRFSDADMKIIKQYGYGPHLIQRASGTVTLQLADGVPPVVHAVDLRGRRIGIVPSKFEKGKLRFTVDTAGMNGMPVMVYEIVR